MKINEIFTALKGSQFFIFNLLLLQLVLCRLAALKVSPHIIHSADYIFFILDTIWIIVVFDTSVVVLFVLCIGV